MTLLLIPAATAALGALLVTGLYGLRRLAEHWRTDSPAALYSNTTPPTALLPERGYLTDAEAIAAEETRRDLARLDAICDRLFQHPLNVVVENAIRELLPPEDRTWVRVHSGEWHLVGVA